MTVSQNQFDSDLSAFTTAVANYETAVAAFVAAVGTAAPNLASEDAEVAASSTALLKRASSRRHAMRSAAWACAATSVRVA